MERPLIQDLQARIGGQQGRGSATSRPPERAVDLGLVIKRIMLAGARGTVTVRNQGETPVSLGAWYVCQFPLYYKLPLITLRPAGQLLVHADAGEDTEREVYAGGRFGELGDDGELALHASGAFESPAALGAYVGWGAGGRRKSVAQAAGIWGTADVVAAQGDTIVFTGVAEGADGYIVWPGSGRGPGQPLSDTNAGDFQSPRGSEGWSAH